MLEPRGVNISSGGYGYWPGSLPGITASRWTFPVVDAVTPKGWTLSWACRPSHYAVSTGTDWLTLIHTSPVVTHTVTANATWSTGILVPCVQSILTDIY